VSSPKQQAQVASEEKFDHPSQKPVALFEAPITNHLSAKGLVYDPFLGSGTCIIAAQRAGAVCYGLELDPRYVDVICARWQDFSGQAPVLERTGRPVNFLKGA